MKMSVIEELGVIGLSALLEEQPHERLALRVGRSVVFAFAGDSAQRRVSILRRSDFKVVVRVRSIVQQQARDSDGVVTGGSGWESSVTKVQEGRPELLAIANIPPPQRAARLGCGSGPFLQDAPDLFQIAAHDSSMNAVERNFRLVREDAQGCTAPSSVGGWTAGQDRIRTSILQKQVRQFCCPVIIEGAGFKLFFERWPARETAFQRERELDVAQSGLGGGLGKGALKTLAGFSVVRPQGFEPALGFLLQIFEGAGAKKLSVHGNLPSV